MSIEANDTTGIIAKAFTTDGKGRHPLYPVLIDNNFKEKDFGEIVKVHHDIKPVPGFAAARAQSEELDKEYAVLFKSQTKFEPLAWYNIFHEAFCGTRFRDEADDIEN